MNKGRTMFTNKDGSWSRPDPRIEKVSSIHPPHAEYYSTSDSQKFLNGIVYFGKSRNL